MRLFSLLSSIINQVFSFIEIEISADLLALKFFILSHPPPLPPPCYFSFDAFGNEESDGTDSK
jgi:hypothetical protein